MSAPVLLLDHRSRAARSAGGLHQGRPDDRQHRLGVDPGGAGLRDELGRRRPDAVLSGGRARAR